MVPAFVFQPLAHYILYFFDAWWDLRISQKVKIVILSSCGDGQVLGGLSLIDMFI
jgi:hypothetical protein